MKRRKILILVGLVLLVSASITVFAAFMFNRLVSGEAKPAEIVLGDLNYLEYSEIVSVEDADTYNAENTYYTLVNNQYTLADVNEETFSSLKSTLYYSTRAAIEVEEDSINCYATEKRGYDDEEDYIYLNQLGFKFNFKSSLDVYLRIEFKDAWISNKVYITTNTIDRKYIPKDEIVDVSPFSYSVNDDWIYDEVNNCAYYKYIIPATCEDVEAADATYSDDYVFQVNPNYWYSQSTSIAYREMIIVETSYNVSIVQANRAEKKWDVNFTDLGIERNYKEEATV